MQIKEESQWNLFPDVNNMYRISISAYADDVTVFISDQNDVNILIEAIGQYEKASSARVNWGKVRDLLLVSGKVGKDLQNYLVDCCG